jgi:hypothetical protein
MCTPQHLPDRLVSRRIVGACVAPACERGLDGVITVAVAPFAFDDGAAPGLRLLATSLAPLNVTFELNLSQTSGAPGWVRPARNRRLRLTWRSAALLAHERPVRGRRSDYALRRDRRAACRWLTA